MQLQTQDDHVDESDDVVQAISSIGGLDSSAAQRANHGTITLSECTHTSSATVEHMAETADHGATGVKAQVFFTQRPISAGNRSHRTGLQYRSKGAPKSSVKPDKFRHFASAHSQPTHGRLSIPKCLVTSDIYRWSGLAAPLQTSPRWSDRNTSSADTSAGPRPSNPGCTKWDPGGCQYPSEGVRHPCLSAHPWEIKEGHGYSVKNVGAALWTACAYPDSIEPPDSDGSRWEREAMLSIQPPVTKDNLKELELPAIQNTLSLRIDLCFDHDLFFQRISGVKGEEKRRKAKVFYQCLSIELRAIAHALRQSCDDCDKSGHQSDLTLPSRLATFFMTLRDLLELLVPDKDKEDVVGRVDPEWLTCQVRVGQFDAATFATWLYNLLTTHCAPMRDEMAREMRDKVVEGFESNNMNLLVEGLETLLNLLENMKIDVANHQVRSFKLLLIADTVPFLQDCFRKLIESDQFGVSCSKEWFNQLPEVRSSQQLTHFERFLHGVLILTCGVNEILPATFGYDKERIQVLRNDILDLVQLSICEQTYSELLISRLGRCPTAAEAREVSDRIVQLITSEDGFSEGIGRHKDAIALELARASADFKLDGRTVSSASLPRNDIRSASVRLQKNLHQKYGKHTETLSIVRDNLYEQTLDFANHFLRVDTLQISNAQRQWSIDRSAKGFPLRPDVKDISRRLAHIAVIHWQVWADLAYTNNGPCSE